MFTTYREERMGFKEAQERERELDRILSFTPAQIEAYKSVLLFLCAVGRVCNSKSCQAHWNLKEAHRYFQIFCRELGLDGPYFVTGEQYSPAIALYYGAEDVEEGKFLFISPWIHDSHAPWRVDEFPEKRLLLKAATQVCRTWLPSWKWPEVEVLVSAS